jgi:hypothetical protein
VKPVLSQAFSQVEVLSAQARALLALVAAAAPEAGKALAGYVRGPAIACCGFGVLCATGVMLYAITIMLT